MKKRSMKFLLYLILGGFIIKGLSFLFGKKNRKRIQVNFKDFLHEEKEEVEELAEGKEGFKKFCCDSGSLIREYFIPDKSNNHKPKILQPKSLVVMVVCLILVKAIVTGYLFFIYPNKARMTEIITQQILKMVNTDRLDNNMAPLVINSALSYAAQDKAEDMIAFNYFDHKSLDGKMPWDWIDRGEYSYLLVGENLAMNFSSAEAAHNALMQSESHKKNILNNKYTDIGLAVISGTLDNKQTNVLVQMFGYRKPQLAIAAEVEPIPTEVQKPVNILPETPVATEEPAPAEILEPEQPVEQIEPTPGGLVEEPEEAQIAVAPVASPVSKNIYTSPNPAIENQEMTQVMSFTVAEDKKITTAANLLKISHYIFLTILALVVFALVINILVRIRIQHKSVIIQTLVVIIFITSLIYVRLHFLESILDKVMVI